MVFTEGTDLPNVQTVIIARPTKNESLYQQMVGRGTRLYPDKEYLTLIDCVGVGDEADLCTAPSLLGLDINAVLPSKRNKLQGNLFDLPDIAYEFQDTPEAWIRNVYYVELWAKKNSYNTHNINFFRKSDGSMSIQDIYIPPEDSLGRVMWEGRLEPTQKVIDAVYERLKKDYADKRMLWDLTLIKSWGDMPATEKQRALVRRIAPLFDSDKLRYGSFTINSKGDMIYECSVEEAKGIRIIYWLKQCYLFFIQVFLKQSFFLPAMILQTLL